MRCSKEGRLSPSVIAWSTGVYAAPVRVTETVLDNLAKLEPLAPLHQPYNLAPIRAIMMAAPQIPQIACFDTAFHRTQSNLAQTFALPRRFSEEGVRRYGFHGLFYEFLASRLKELAPELATGGSSSLTWATARACAR